ncbi:hemagglutinin repeat-containing protein [Alysiella crassa]|uniref:hemagglutinin repeat-containing protein n=1 Tax=Alysiella crassa TaxID=153491 RepID=UPI0036708015
MSGISAYYGQNGMAFGITAGGNYGKGHGNGESLTHRHTQVGDSNSATVLQSGGQTTIKGAQTHGKGIDLSAQDLLIESVQDTAKFNSKQEKHQRTSNHWRWCKCSAFLVQ